MVAENAFETCRTARETHQEQNTGQHQGWQNLHTLRMMAPAFSLRKHDAETSCFSAMVAGAAFMVRVEKKRGVALRQRTNRLLTRNTFTREAQRVYES